MSIDTPILRPEQHWECPSCDVTSVTHVVGIPLELHRCSGQRGVWIPMVLAGTKAMHVVHLAEDYVSGRNVQTDAEGRPVTHVNLIRDDGMDAVAFPAPAIVTKEEMDEIKEALSA